MEKIFAELESYLAIKETGDLARRKPVQRDDCADTGVPIVLYPKLNAWSFTDEVYKGGYPPLDEFWAICPECRFISSTAAGNPWFICDDCDEIYCESHQHMNEYKDSESGEMRFHDRCPPCQKASLEDGSTI